MRSCTVNTIALGDILGFFDLDYGLASKASIPDPRRSGRDGSLVRGFRIWGKKRGDRRTGSELLGSVGEVIFFAALSLISVLALVAYVTDYVTRVDDESDVSWTLGLVVLVLGTLLLTGVGGLTRNVLRVGASAERRSALARRAVDIELLSDALGSPRDFPTIPRNEDLTNSPGICLAYRLPIARSPAWRFLGIGFVCVLWNAFVAVIAVLALQSFLSGEANWFLTFFTLPFAVVGARLIEQFFRQLLMATGVGPTSIEVSDQPFMPGKPYQFHISQAGRLKVKSLSLLLVCDEQAIFRQGTDIRTERRRVYRQQVFRKEDFDITHERPFEQTCDLRIPDDVMHSFKSDHNSIQWRLVVVAAVDRWPRFQRDFPVLVYPPIDLEPAHGTAHQHSALQE